MGNRDDFRKPTIALLGRQVGYLCSNPDCGVSTLGASATGDGAVNVGIAAHIAAAAPKGPRFNASMSSEDRSHANNGIWLCSICAHKIDVKIDEPFYTVEKLNDWKREALARSHANLGRVPGSLELALAYSQDDDGSADDEQAANPDHVAERMRPAAMADLQKFRNQPGWPQHIVELDIRIDDRSPELALEAFAGALEVFGDVAFYAPPGSGKTTSLVRIAEHVVARGQRIAVVLPLPEWNGQAGTILDALVRRASFTAFSEADFRVLAEHGRLVLLMDGWNELDLLGRTNVRRALGALRRDYPLLSLALASRRQASLPPLGQTLQIAPLTEAQQLDLARASKGESGVALLHSAWRTIGLRDLVATPLFLRALLEASPGGTLPTTREAALRIVVEAQLDDQNRADLLNENLQGAALDLICAVAVAGMNRGVSVLDEVGARTAINAKVASLAAQGQVGDMPSPVAILDLLANHHLLVRTEGGVSFQHQQFQEWFAAGEVRRLIMAATDDPDARRQLDRDILNWPHWSEAVLFAIDAMGQSADAEVRAAVAETIVRCLGIAPLLAADMIFRGGQSLWPLIADQVVGFVGRWGQDGPSELILGFKIATGRPEFADAVWPLISDPDTQVRFPALRAASPFRIGVLGPDARQRLALCSSETRADIVSEIAFQGDIEGIDFAAEMGRSDPDPDVKLAIVNALQFRRADRHVMSILGSADDALITRFAEGNWFDGVDDPVLLARLRELLEAKIGSGDLLTRFSWLVDRVEVHREDGAGIAALLADPDFPVRGANTGWLVQRAHSRYPDAVAGALWRRLEVGLELPFRAEDLVRTLELVESGPQAERIVNGPRGDALANAGALRAGPDLTKRLMARLEELAAQRPQGGPRDAEIDDRFNAVRNRILSVPAASLAQACIEIGREADRILITRLSHFIARHGRNDESPSLELSTDEHLLLVEAIVAWSERTLADPEAGREDYAELARAIGRLAAPELVDVLARLLERELNRRQAEQAQFARRPHLRPPAFHMDYTGEYGGAFVRIGSDAAVQVLIDHLADVRFNGEAATSLLQIHRGRSGADVGGSWRRRWPDFSDALANRARREAASFDPPAVEASAMAHAIERLIGSDGTAQERESALTLGKVMLAMPHPQNDQIGRLLALDVPEDLALYLMSAWAMTGAVLSSERVESGLVALFERARDQPWLLDAQHDDILRWLELLAYSDRPMAMLEAYDRHVARIQGRDLGHLITAIRYSGGSASQLLLDLSARDVSLLGRSDWQSAMLDIDPHQFLELAQAGRLRSERGQQDFFRLSRMLAARFEADTELMNSALALYVREGGGQAREVLEAAFAQIGGDGVVLAIMNRLAAAGRTWSETMAESVKWTVLKRVFAVDGGSYEIAGVNASPLRLKLFELTQGTDQLANIASKCLELIDLLRSESGVVEDEPHHPDIASGRPWPKSAPH